MHFRIVSLRFLDRERCNSVPSIDGQPGHHNSAVPLLSTNVNGFSITPNVRVPSLDDVRLVDENVGVDVGCVNPVAGHVLGQATTGFDDFGFDRRDPQTLGTFFHRFEGVAFGGDGHPEVEVVVPVLQEASVLFVLTGLFGVGHGEEVVLVDEPVAEAAVLDHWKYEFL